MDDFDENGNPYKPIITKIMPNISIITNIKESQANNKIKQTKARTRKLAQAGLFDPLLSKGSYLEQFRVGGDFYIKKKYISYSQMYQIMILHAEIHKCHLY